MKGLTCFAKEFKMFPTGDMCVEGLLSGKWKDHFGKSILSKAHFGKSMLPKHVLWKIKEKVGSRSIKWILQQFT